MEQGHRQGPVGKVGAALLLRSTETRLTILDSESDQNGSSGYEGNEAEYDVVWHDVRTVDRSKDHTTDTIYIYLRRVILHEFGHTAGLEDLDLYGDYPGLVMDRGTAKVSTVPSGDIEYLKQVYRDDHGASPH